jgi:hypothetical protein
MKEALGIEDDKLTPEQQVNQLQSHNSDLEFRLAVMDTALENGVSSKDGIDYLTFLMEQKAASMGENDELSDEDLQGLIAKAKAVGGGGSAQGGGSTSVTGTKPPSGQQGSVTVEQFTKMSVAEKGQLYQNNPDLYNSLFQQARDKHLLT